MAETKKPMTEDEKVARSRQQSANARKKKGRDHRPLTDEEKAERTSRLPQQGPDPEIYEGNVAFLRDIAERMGISGPTDGVLDVDLRNIGRWLRSWPHGEPMDEILLEAERQTLDDQRNMLDVALATLFLAPGAKPTEQVARLVADRYEHRIAVKRRKGDQWHEVRWQHQPLQRFEHAVELAKPAGGLVTLQEQPDGLWRCHFLPRVSAQNDLSGMHHTRHADHWTPALACCTVLLPR